ncbi:MAG TPA: hypothetical protein PLP57_08975 [Candidatus Saccharicenans sp.]|mgnify:CR=1 FL=1|nr:hypothetical protein [Candidatus Saccharicenans sp.]HRD02756.1 hypothetical protein [Candidatus Saccharicenans sp.]
MSQQKTPGRSEIEEVARRLWVYCLKNDFSGYDPYDALNSPLFSHGPWARSRLVRLAATQGLKRLPINIRPLLLIPKTQNPKALAIFLKAALRLTSAGIIENMEIIKYLIKRIAELRTAEANYYGWGYNFPWQTRTIFVPRGAPNLVCTIFVADALLDAYDIIGKAECLKMARTAVDYIFNELFWSEKGSAGFSYPQPGIKEHTYNANLLGAALLSRISKVTREKNYLEAALTVAGYAASCQNKDGSWYYGERAESRWIDNFHTGYNLIALRDLKKYAETDEFDQTIKKGFSFYIKNFFRQDGAPKYYHDRVYPIDSHCLAQSIITLEAFRELNKDARQLSLSVLKWGLENMWSGKGYFYYQRNRFYTNLIPYMRWTEAWMLLALSELLAHSNSL